MCHIHRICATLHFGARFHTRLYHGSAKQIQDTGDSLFIILWLGSIEWHSYKRKVYRATDKEGLENTLFCYFNEHTMYMQILTLMMIIWCFMALSKLFKSYQDNERLCN